MAKKKPEPTPYAIKRKLEDILNSDGNSPGRPLVLNGSGRKEVVKINGLKSLVSVRDNIVRIQEHADPVGFLVSVQNGDLIPVHFVDEDGNVGTVYQSAAITDRIATAKYLASKIMPNLSLIKHTIEEPSAEDSGPMDPSRPGQPSFAQLVSMAASKRRTTAVIEVRDGPEEEAAGASGTEDEPSDGEDGGSVRSLG